MPLSKVDIINETVEYYKTNPRSVNYLTNLSKLNSCLYIGHNGSKCAFSRCCTDDSLFIEGQNPDRQLDAQLKEEYSHIPKEDHFWCDLQLLHDNSHYWTNEKTLSDHGKRYYDEIIHKYSDSLSNINV